jgi:tetratricopeptide (TPR) repeat protein
MPTFEDEESDLLDTLGQIFLRALARKDRGDVDEAEELLRDILRKEPRLGEPHLELARLLLDTDRVSDAEDHAREAIQHLEGTGVWIDDPPENVILGLAHATLAESLRRRADEEDVIFGDPAQFHAIVAEARAHFQRANELDPSDEYASYHAFFMGVPTPKARGAAAGGPDEPGDEDPDILDGDEIGPPLLMPEPGEA